MASSTARLFKIGSVPGRPRQTGQTFEFGASPKPVGAGAENFGVGQKLDMDFQADDGLVFREDLGGDGGQL